MKYFLIALTFLTFSMTLNASDGFVCENTTEYKDYMSGSRETLDDAPKFPSDEVCVDSCVEYNSCIVKTETINNQNFFPLLQYFNENDKNLVVEKMNQGIINKIMVTKDEIYETVAYNPGVDMAGWIPPIELPTNDDPVLTKTYYSSGFGWQWVKTLNIGMTDYEYKSSSINKTSLSSIWGKASPGYTGTGIHIIEIDGSMIALPSGGQVLSYPSLPGMIYQDSYNYVQMKDELKILTTFQDKKGEMTASNTKCDGDDMLSSRWDEAIIKSKPIIVGSSCEWEEFDAETVYFLEYKVAGTVKTAFKSGNISSFKLYSEHYVLPVKYLANISINGSLLEMETGVFLDATGVEVPHMMKMDIDRSNTGYRCLLFPDSLDIGGDLLPNLFSRSSDCNDVCKVQYQCIEWKESDCELMGSEVSNPVTDYTGKTIYTRKTYDWHCTKEFEEQVACSKWEIETAQGGIKYGTYDPGYDDLDFSANFGEAISTAQIAEQMQHIWSGWAGYCEDGILFDNSWMSDPLQLLSLGFMFFSGAMEGVYGATMESTTHAIAETAVSAAESAANAVVDWVGQMGALSQEAWGAASTAIAETAAKAQMAIVNTSSYIEVASYTGSIATSINELADIGLTATNAEVFDYARGILSVVQAGLAEMNEEDIKTADHYMSALLGQDTGDDRALAYANCMASIGMSFVDMAAWTSSSTIPGVDDERPAVTSTLTKDAPVEDSATSEELQKPWEYPLRLTRDQFTILQYLAKDEVKGSYWILEDQFGITTVLALNSTALTRLGEAFCMQELNPAMAKDYLTRDSTEDPDKDIAGAVAMAAIGVGLSMLPPPANLIASILFKIMTSISNGNACDDEELAMKWGIIQAKTNKALQGAQCHMVRSECVAEWFWGACMRDRNYYCCYDQETTRIFVEGVKEQLQRGWEDCSDITIFDLQNVSFRECQGNERPSVNKCFPSGKYKELIDALTKNAIKGLDVERLKDQAVQGLTLPGQGTPWD